MTDIHAWFGLSYANYLVVPRALLQSMPTEWQERLVGLLEEMDDHFGRLDLPSYDVRALKRPQTLIYEEEPCGGCDGEGRIGEDECEECGGMGKRESDYGDYRYETPEEVGFRADPIPHYNRGRAFVEGQS